VYVVTMAGARTRRQAAAEQQQAAHAGNGEAQVTPRGVDAVPESTENVFLFWPNIIGYWRIVLAIGALWYMPLHPRTCSALYSVSCLLDALDGYAARYLNQSTKFGAVLDMVTDRCTTACLLVSILRNTKRDIDLSSPGFPVFCLSSVGYPLPRSHLSGLC
jgi:CDP-diacylglycerol--inositol 3-phosphatidyltransferase